MSIILTDLVKRFGNTLIVNNVSLEIKDGELFVLLGASGSGKSTILRMIAGLTEPDSGRIELNGRDVTHLSPQARNTGFVFQNYSIFRHMNALQNVEFGLAVRRVPAAERRRRAEELLDMVGLAGLGERYGHQLSGGQQQRIALARALAHEPAVLLLDEPFGALDVKIRSQLRETLKNIQRQLSVTTILVTHDQEEAFELADRIGLLDHGHLVEVNTPENLYHHPSTEFAATFIGGGNVLVGKMDGNEIKLGTVSLPVEKDAPTHDAGAPVRILFRPESVLVQPQPFTSDSGVHVLGEGQVVGRTFAGALERVRLSLDGLQSVPTSTESNGDHMTQIDASLLGGPDVSAELASRQTLWAGLRGYHILAPTGLKTLICADGSPAGEAAAKFGFRLAQEAHGPATLLGIASSSKALAAMQETLETLRQKWPEGQNQLLQIRARQGNPVREILLEAQEGYYELIVMGRDSSPDQTIERVLEQIRIPVLLVQEPRPTIQRILIGTVGGFGGADVRFTGRIARRTGANVTILNVRPRASTPEQRKRMERNVRLLQYALESSGVSSELKVEEGRFGAHVLQEADAGEYDLIVISSASLPRGRQFQRWTGGRANQLIRRITRPVLIIPVGE